MSVSTVHKILRNILHYYPHNITFVEKLFPADLPVRYNFLLAWKWTMTFCGQTKLISIFKALSMLKIAIWATDNSFAQCTSDALFCKGSV